MLRFMVRVSGFVSNVVYLALYISYTYVTIFLDGQDCEYSLC